MKIGILRNEDIDSSLKWEIACKKLNIDYTVIDFISTNWLSEINSESFEFFLAKPSGISERYKTLYDERLYILTHFLKKTVYPSYDECFVYENKKNLASFLQANNLPHPKTHIFYKYIEALSFIKSCKYPIVAKTSIGAAGSGVKIIKTASKSSKYIDKAFKGKGIGVRFGPNPKSGSPKSWFLKTISNPEYFVKKWKSYMGRYRETQKGYVIFQEYLEHEFEWRCVRIGNSYFAYKKLKIDDKASGSKAFEYGEPPLEILDFTKELCEKFNFNFMAVDLFYIDKKVYINELQTLFGHKNPYICKINDITGKYRNLDSKWGSEPGDFNSNESYDLRLQVALELFENEKK